MKFGHLIVPLLGAAAGAVTAAVVEQPLVPLTFPPLHVGQIKPTGWLRDQLVLQANGLGGHLMDFWKYVSQSAWIGGTVEYSLLHEAFPYWLNAIVPLAYGVNDSRLIAQVRSAADYVLEHQQPDGWLGYETGTNRNMWPRNLLCLALMQLAQADETYTERVVDSMQRFAVVMNSMLAENYTGFIYHDGDEFSEGGTEWGLSRAQDLMIPLMWLHDYHPGNDTLSRMLLENMQYLYEAGVNWDYFYRADVFPQGELDELDQDFYNSLPWEYFHGVNQAEGLKAVAVYRRFLHDDSMVELSHQGVNWTFFYHGSASGSILADEYMNGLQAYMGAETCTAVEAMYSLTYLYQALGENMYADMAERAAFNALPGAMSPDWWARQYMSEPNQPWSQNLTSTPFSDVNSVGQMYTLEGNYPCCTVNHPQGYPKFLAAAFVTVGEEGLANVLLSPTNVTATLGNGSAGVFVDARTKYPFEMSVVYTVNSTAAFDFYVRVPVWADVSTSTISLTTSSNISNTTSLFSATETVSPDATSGLHLIPLPPGLSQLNYSLSTSIRTEARPNNSIAIFHGPLLYSLAIDSTNSSTDPWDYRTNAPMEAGYAPPEARDWTIRNTSPWDYAVDPSSLEYHFEEGELANPIWAPGAPPGWITARACRIEWGLYLASVPDRVPAEPEGGRVCVGSVEEVVLRPFGSQKVHMSDLPVIDLSGMA